VFAALTTALGAVAALLVMHQLQQCATAAALSTLRELSEQYNAHGGKN
jgi:cell division protein ZapA (FtsZ GTPase activity inhibitor)